MERLQKLEKMLQQEPSDVFLNFGLAMELVKVGREEDALVQFDRVLTLDPTYAVAYLQKGTTLIGLKRHEDAASVLEAGVETARAAGDGHAADEIQGLLDAISR